jgi:hypothetical protein
MDAIALAFTILDAPLLMPASPMGMMPMPMPAGRGGRD